MDTGGFTEGRDSVRLVVVVWRAGRGVVGTGACRERCRGTARIVKVCSMAWIRREFHSLRLLWTGFRQSGQACIKASTNALLDALSRLVQYCSPRRRARMLMIREHVRKVQSLRASPLDREKRISGNVRDS